MPSNDSKTVEMLPLESHRDLPPLLPLKSFKLIDGDPPHLVAGVAPALLCRGDGVGATGANRAFTRAKASGVVRYIGRGLNRWSNVRIADLYVLALAKAPAGTFMYVESGEEALGEIAKAIAARLVLGGPQSWSAEEAIAAWGRNTAVFHSAPTVACAAKRQSSLAGHPLNGQSRVGLPTKSTRSRDPRNRARTGDNCARPLLSRCCGFVLGRAA